MKPNHPKRSVCVRVGSELDKNLKAAAEEKGMSVSKFVAEAVKDFLKEAPSSEDRSG